MFGFKKRPENDINQYHVLIPRNKHGDFTMVFIVKTTDFNRMIAENKDDPKFKSGSIKEAIKYVKYRKGRTILQVFPEELEGTVFQYVQKHCPRSLWEYDLTSKYSIFN